MLRPPAKHVTLVEVARQSGFSPPPSPSCSTPRPSRRRPHQAAHDRHQLEGYLQLLMERRVEGLIVVANWLFEEGGVLFEVLRNSFPAIVVGRDLAHDRIRSVVVDNEAGGYAALKHLYDLGHRKIVTPPCQLHRARRLRRPHRVRRAARPGPRRPARA